MPTHDQVSSPALSAFRPDHSRFTFARLWPYAVLFVAVGLFYWKPITAPEAHIQWDAVDIHYSAQRYLSEHVRAGHLPFWTPYVFSGFPFLADPQVGAWYPLNWPFLIAGITPRSIEYEVILHVLLACAGAYLLALELVKEHGAALIAGLGYGLSGFFAGHSSHVGMIQTAAWFPWLLFAYLRAVEGPSRRWLALAGIIGGTLTLAGHFQTSLYSFAALGLFALALLLHGSQRWSRLVLSCAAVVVLALLIAAVEALPGLELVRNSVRAHFDYASDPQSALPASALLTLVLPNQLGALSGTYVGPWDRTQYYFYAGLLLMPLAIMGLRRRPASRLALWMIIPAVWYALGPSAGLYRLAGELPGFRSIRAPVHVWFVVALGLALLAGAGVAGMPAYLRRPYVTAGLVLVLFADMFYWNAPPNRLAYSPVGFHSRYDVPQEQFRRILVPTQPALTRFHAPESLAFGSLNHPLDLHVEATYGFNPLELSRYAQYLEAASTNPRLLNGLNVSRILDTPTRTIKPNPGALPRFSIPTRIVAAEGADPLELLRNSDPADQAIVADHVRGEQQDGSAMLSIEQHDEEEYVIHYRAAATTVLRASIPYYPGWRATADGVPCEVVPLDYALLGIIAPPGDHRLRLQYHSNYFALGAGLTLTGPCLAAALALSQPRA